MSLSGLEYALRCVVEALDKDTFMMSHRVFHGVNTVSLTLIFFHLVYRSQWELVTNFGPCYPRTGLETAIFDVGYAVKVRALRFRSKAGSAEYNYGITPTNGQVYEFILL